jgi:transcription antitermination factor NusG
MNRQIFISYRRDDAPYPAGRLYDRLLVRLPNNQIFIDVDLEPGIDFVEEIERSVGSCDVLIAVIGKRWLLSSVGKGKRRLENPEDFVRVEIATALKRNIRVIPVLVDGASMPRSGDLPDDLKLLARRNALEVSYNRFNADFGRLVAAIERALEQAPAERKQSEKPRQLKPTTAGEADLNKALERNRFVSYLLINHDMTSDRAIEAVRKAESIADFLKHFDTKIRKDIYETLTQYQEARTDLEEMRLLLGLEPLPWEATP